MKHLLCAKYSARTLTLILLSPVQPWISCLTFQPYFFICKLGLAVFFSRSSRGVRWDNEWEVPSPWHMEGTDTYPFLFPLIFDGKFLRVCQVFDFFFFWPTWGIQSSQARVNQSRSRDLSRSCGNAGFLTHWGAGLRCHTCISALPRPHQSHCATVGAPGLLIWLNSLRFPLETNALFFWAIVCFFIKWLKIRLSLNRCCI